MARTRYLTGIVLVALLVLGGLAIMAPSVAATGIADNESTDNESIDNESTEIESADSDSDKSEVCKGNPQMSRTSITTPQDRITTEDPAKIEANFRVDPNVPEECTVVVDIQYSFTQSGFQFGGGADWEQSATDIVATRFDNLNSGEIRSISADVYTNGAEPGDEVTVIADYEIWYEGDRDNSRQQSGIRYTVEVEEPNSAPESTTEAEEPADPQAESSTETTDAAESSFIEENFALLGVFVLAALAILGLSVRN